MTPEAKARQSIDKKLEQSGWVIQDRRQLNLTVSLGVAIREFRTSTGPVDYALFVEGKPVGVIEAKRTEEGVNLGVVEEQSSRYAHSKFKYVQQEYEIRFVYEATDKIIHFTDYHDKKYRSREVFSFFRPETLRALIAAPDTVRNNLRHMPPLDERGFWDCQVNAIKKLDESLAHNKPKALIQMATGSGKTFTAVTACYRMLKYGKMSRILFLVDTKNLGIQAQDEFLKYTPNDDTRTFAQLYVVQRLTKSNIPQNIQICISTIQRMYSILKGEELDESAEEIPFSESPAAAGKKPKEVIYNAEYPPEFFDCIIVDECHRSIYNIWSQILTYFDAFIIGLTATPDARTFGFFDENIVSEYSREQAIADGVNVGEDIYLIETDITKNGAILSRQETKYRDRLSREQRWKQMDEDEDYSGTNRSKLDEKVVNPSQIRTIIKTFHEKLFTEIYPHRGTEVPKTLIFAKNDSHADDIVKIVREEFGEGNEFCKKITYRADGNSDNLIKEFRNNYNPRIAVTVDMIATGTDVKPIEILLFMRDVHSYNYYEQMVGRGTRVLSEEDLRKVTPSATGNKDHFVIIDAVGVTKSVKSQTRPLEYKPKVSLKDLMFSVAVGSRDAETLTSLANRIIRLNGRMTDSERRRFTDVVGNNASTVAQNLLNAYDADAILQRAQEDNATESPTPEQLEQAKTALITAAVQPFNNPEVRNFIEDVRRVHDQIIDNVNLDSVTYAGYDTQREENADMVIKTFREFIEENKDEIIALRIIYDQKYADRPMVIEQLKALYDKLKARRVSIERLWDCYAIKHPEKVKRGTQAQLTDLISIIRFEMGATQELQPFAKTVDYNFQQWVFKRNAGSVHFTEQQMEWLRLIKEHIITSLSILPEDLDLTPFDRKGGLLSFYNAFGESYKQILDEMNLQLVA